ncbi:MAG: FKBP-type peptidyl-prolyl cis-trans isomerase [Bacteroidales bacterium]|nr:FKBP-type peptidyl-prolyl cis-trans isomerase [Bacteroidales bacterium]
MKKNLLFAALVLCIAAMACQPKNAAEPAEGEEVAPVEEAVAPAPAPKTSKDFKVSKATRDSVAYLVGINFGSFIKGYDFGDLNYCQIKKGMRAFIKAKGNPRDPDFGEQFKIDPNEMNRIFNEYLENRHQQKLLANKEAGEKFLAKNLKKEGVEVSESGLQYKIIEAGSELVPVNDKDTVWVRYKGTLLDGTVFDEVKPEADSVRFTLDRVVKGWTEGMKYVGEGGKIRLFIPAELAYGERAPQNIGPNQTLIFDIELCKVALYQEPAEEEEVKK